MSAIEPINLNLVRFTQGIEYLFVETQDFASLPAGRLLPAGQGLASFEARYGKKLPVVGQYAGSLNNGGERIELLDAAGGIIQSFEYKDSWFDQTDGMGFSLTILDPQADGNDPENWHAATPSPGR